MSEDTSVHQGKNEIVIVRRRNSGAGDGHHGGAWKIAYADFMTAMMAFFLVMWLVNAANEETKASVASYFNPIKLMDDKPTDRGIKQAGSDAEGELEVTKSMSDGNVPVSGEAGEGGKRENPTVGEKKDYSEADYFENPYSVLAEIAQETGNQTNISKAGEAGAANSGPATGASGGEAYRDPFDPDFWSKQIEQSQAADQAAEAQEGQQGGRPAEMTAEGDAIGKAISAAGESPDGTGQPNDGADRNTAQVAGEAGEQVVDAGKLKDEIIQALGGSAGKLAEGLTVTPTEGGLLVSITDQLDFGMFRIGSAIPERELVLAMEKIGKILAERKGAIAIRGHTDARPFANGTGDNWDLSMSRAHSAYFMLVRGGVPEERIVQVSGFADRRLKDPERPFAEVNRRIEILVEAEGG